MDSGKTSVLVRDVGKMYRLFNSGSDRLKEALHPLRKRYHREYWALRGVNLQIRSGETFGIIGRNGSGKSTLLQIVAGILKPTEGSVEVTGRVAPLLELGAGFNPEFTGRDNVLLNAAIMGLSRGEMNTRMPLIEAFADIGEFFDQPVKFYSSGMYARLAFAAAINVDPDLLIVDEILAVGDARFQNRCYNRIQEFQAAGKTVIFVTHDLNAVASYCNRAALLDAGKVVAVGDPAGVIDRYMALLFGEGGAQDKSSRGGQENQPASVAIGADAALGDAADASDLCITRKGYNRYEVRHGPRHAEIIDCVAESGGEYDPATIRFGARVNLYIKVLFHQPMAAPVIGFTIKTVDGTNIYGTNTGMLGIPVSASAAGQARLFRFSFPAPLLPRPYFLDIGVAEYDGTTGGVVIDLRRSLAILTIQGEDRMLFDGLVDIAPTFGEIGTIPADQFDRGNRSADQAGAAQPGVPAHSSRVRAET